MPAIFFLLFFPFIKIEMQSNLYLCNTLTPYTNYVDFEGHLEVRIALFYVQ